MIRKLFVAAALSVVAASAANAQITTYIAPPRAAEPTKAMVAAADSARRDSVAQVAVTNMKAWVDSAAGVGVPATVGDSTVVVTDSARVTTFSNGSVAPATASDLPALALAGLAAFVVGAALLSTRPRG